MANVQAAQDFQTFETGYSKMHSTKPQTLSYALTDSPVGDSQPLPPEYTYNRPPAVHILTAHKFILLYAGWFSILMCSGPSPSANTALRQTTRRHLACTLIPHLDSQPLLVLHRADGVDCGEVQDMERLWGRCGVALQQGRAPDQRGHLVRTPSCSCNPEL